MGAGLTTKTEKEDKYNKKAVQKYFGKYLNKRA